MKRDKHDGMPPAALILGVGHSDDSDHDLPEEDDKEAPDDYDTGDTHEAADESIRAIHARDPEGHADAIHQLIDARLRHHGILKDSDEEDAEAGAEKEGEEETTGKGHDH
jgi:hypothetical protein